MTPTVAPRNFNGLKSTLVGPAYSGLAWIVSVLFLGEPGRPSTTYLDLKYDDVWEVGVFVPLSLSFWFAPYSVFGPIEVHIDTNL